MRSVKVTLQLPTDAVEIEAGPDSVLSQEYDKFILEEHSTPEITLIGFITDDEIMPPDPDRYTAGASEDSDKHVILRGDMVVSQVKFQIRG